MKYAIKGLKVLLEQEKVVQRRHGSYKTPNEREEVREHITELEQAIKMLESVSKKAGITEDELRELLKSLQEIKGEGG